MMRSLPVLLALAFLLGLSACSGTGRGVDPYSVRSFDPDKQNLTQSSPFGPAEGASR